MTGSPIVDEATALEVVTRLCLAGGVEPAAVPVAVVVDRQSWGPANGFLNGMTKKCRSVIAAAFATQLAALG